MHGDHIKGVGHAAHGQSNPANNGLLTELRQEAFAALSEVVRLLEADPGTD